jgi:hypothetical protein
MAQEETAAAEFDAIEAQTAAPAENGAAAPADENGTGARPGAPLLTIGELVRPTETVRVRGALYELKYSFDYSFGRQTLLAKERNATLVYMNREIAGEELTADELAEQRFFLRRIARAALPDLARAQIEGVYDDERQAWTVPPLSDAELEDVATIFFGRTREIRDAAETARQSGSPPISRS